MSTKPRILFVSHSATRNGATILLLHLLRWLREHTEYQMEVLVNGRGELVDEFKAIGRTTVWRDPTFFLNAFRRNGWKARAESQCLKWRMLGRSYDLVYFNTSAVASHVTALSKRADRVLWHIHELEYALRCTIGEEGIRRLFPLATRIVVASSAVRATLEQQFQVPGDKLDLVHEFIPTPTLTMEESQSRRRRVRRKLGWPDNAFVVGACGALGWRKGTDIFLQVARNILTSRNQDPVYCLWVGDGSRDEVLRFEHDSRSLGLALRCQRVPATPDIMDYYCAMDVFALTSREDPFPLVMLEAGALGLPVVCFAGSGGGPEFVADDAGLIAPYLDVAAFSKHIEALLDAPELRRRYGTGAAMKVCSRHVVEVQGPKLLTSIKRCLSENVLTA